MFKRFHTSFFRVPSFAILNRVPENEGGENIEDKGDEGKEKGGGGEGKEKPETVSRADHDRALADLHKYKKAAAEATKKEKDAETARLKESNDWKTLAETREAEAKEATEKAERIQSSYIGDRKFNAIKAKCDALGLRPEAVSDLESLDLADIAIETTSTGKINVLGADKFASALKAKKPHWFDAKAAPRVNTNGTRVLDSSDAITAKDLLAAEAEGKKSGDMTKYYDAHKKYQQQRAAAMGRR